MLDKHKILVVAGPEGIGKSALIHKLIGNLSSSTVSSEHVKGHRLIAFNDNLESDVLVVVDVSITSLTPVLSNLKPIVSNGKVIINKKGLKPYTVPSPYVIVELTGVLKFCPGAHIERRVKFAVCSAPGWFEKMMANAFCRAPVPRYKVYESKERG